MTLIRPTVGWLLTYRSSSIQGFIEDPDSAGAVNALLSSRGLATIGAGPAPRTAAAGAAPSSGSTHASAGP